MTMPPKLPHPLLQRPSNPKLDIEINGQGKKPANRTSKLPFVWRDQYAAMLDEKALQLAEAEERVKDAEAERDAAHLAHTASVDRTLQACKERDAAKDIATRALILLNKVDTTRTGGKQLKMLIDVLLSDAIEQGLWGELPTKEEASE